jgi:alanyl-tRNA synthetase
MDSANLNPNYIIADHIRASCFIIADGVMPSGKQRGYILRRLIRRSLSASLKLNIDISNPNYFIELVESVIKIYEGVYDQLSEYKDAIIQILIAESQKYLKAIAVGEKEWAKILK